MDVFFPPEAQNDFPVAMQVINPLIFTLDPAMNSAILPVYLRLRCSASKSSDSCLGFSRCFFFGLVRYAYYHIRRSPVFALGLFLVPHIKEQRNWVIMKS